MEIRRYFDEGQSGTVGTVYRAEDELGREVAVKFFNTSFSLIREQVKGHAQALTKIVHPNVVRIFGVEDLKRPGADPDAPAEPALVMEYCPGQKFSDWLNKPGLTKTEASQVIRGLLAALGAFHVAKLAHGDLHAGNIKVYNSDVKLIDPVARDPNHVLTTADLRQQQLSDLSFAKRLVVDALRACNANSSAFGEFCMLHTNAFTVQELLQQAELALRDPFSDGRETPILIHSFYDFCRGAQRAPSPVPWQEARKAAVRSVQPRLNEWRKRRHQLPTEFELLSREFADAIDACGELLAFLLAAAELGGKSALPEMKLLRNVLALDWERSGDSRFVGVPETLFLSMHYFVGAAAVQNGHFEVAKTLGNMKVFQSRREARVSVSQETRLTGWGPVFDADCDVTLRFLFRAYELLPVLRQVFPDEQGFRVSFGVYNWLLCLLDLGHQDPSKLTPSESEYDMRPLFKPKVAPFFLRLKPSEISSCYEILMEDFDGEDVVVEKGNIDVTRLRSLWKDWLFTLVRFWTGSRSSVDPPNFIFEARR